MQNILLLPFREFRKLKEVRIPDGLSTIWSCLFTAADIESVEIPASVKEIEVDAFYNCKKLRYVIFAEGSQLEKIGEGCFSGSGIEEIAFPSTLKEVGENAFQECGNLKTIRLAGEHEVDLTRAGIPDSAKVILLSVTLPGNVRLQDLRQMKDVVIPDGVRRIGNNWFWGSEVEKVEIPASVEEIGEGAFCNCVHLM